jgi:hypothetical protein
MLNGTISNERLYEWLAEDELEWDYKLGFDLHLCARHCEIPN